MCGVSLYVRLCQCVCLCVCVCLYLCVWNDEKDAERFVVSVYLLIWLARGLLVLLIMCAFVGPLVSPDALRAYVRYKRFICIPLHYIALHYVTLYYIIVTMTSLRRDCECKRVQNPSTWSSNIYSTTFKNWLNWFCSHTKWMELTWNTTEMTLLCVNNNNNKK